MLSAAELEKSFIASRPGFSHDMAHSCMSFIRNFVTFRTVPFMTLFIVICFVLNLCQISFFKF